MTSNIKNENIRILRAIEGEGDDQKSDDFKVFFTEMGFRYLRIRYPHISSNSPRFWNLWVKQVMSWLPKIMLYISFVTRLI